MSKRTFLNSRYQRCYFLVSKCQKAFFASVGVKKLVLAGDRSRSRTDRATAVSARTFGIQSPHEDLQTDIRQQKVAWLSCRFYFS